MDSHERALTLAIMGVHGHIILTEMPDSVASEIECEIEPKNLAGHLVKMGAERSADYLYEMYEMGGRTGELLSLMNPESAAKILEMFPNFEITAKVLNSVDSKQTAWIIQHKEAWEAAIMLEHMQPECTVQALTQTEPAFREAVLQQMNANIDRKTYQDEKLTPAEFEKVRSKRKNNVNYLTAQLSN